MKNCVLRIWYSKNGKSYPYPQGKIFKFNGKWIYLADMDEGKRIRFCNGWAISEQILEAFKKAKIRPQIIYRWRQQNSLYIATPSLIKKKGFKRVMNWHTQYIVPVSSWEVKTIGQMELGEIFDLPVLDVSSWLKNEPEIKWGKDEFSYA